MLSFFAKRMKLTVLLGGTLLLFGCASFLDETDRAGAHSAGAGNAQTADAGNRKNAGGADGENVRAENGQAAGTGDGQAAVSMDGDAADAVDGQRGAEEGYYYRALEDDGLKAVYQKMYAGMKQMGRDEVLDCQDEDQLYRVFCCVLADHPELFYVTGYTYAKVMQDDRIDHMIFSATYSMSEEETVRCQSGIDAYAAECLREMPKGDDYE